MKTWPWALVKTPKEMTETIGTGLNSLNWIGRPVRVFVPVLILAFEQIADDRLEIAATLGHFESLAKEATGCLTSALEDKNPKVRQGAADAIQKIRMGKK